MQVFIKEGTLVDMTSDVPVIAYYPDGTVLVENMHGPDAFVMYAPDASIISSSTGPLPVVVMKQDWRSNSAQSAKVIDYEANRRINIAFPAEEQRQSNNLINQAMMTYGVDTSTWPPAVQSKKATIDSGWNYIDQVNQTAESMKQASPPLDPTDDAHWPTPITPIDI